MVIKEEAKEKEKDVVIVIEIVKCEHNDDNGKKWPKATFFYCSKYAFENIFSLPF